MKIDQKYADAINDQVTLEHQASLVYRQLAADMEAIDLSGIASWFSAQADEELVHAAKFTQYLHDRDYHPVLGTIELSGNTVDNALDAFKASLAHEEKVSEAIRNLYRIADEVGDIDSRPLLYWFLDEQVEEESTVSEIIGRIELLNGDGSGLLTLDRQLGQRDASAE
ncbi:ferritin [Gulosibacter molinativorax]|uniref:Ferritin n=1 Tax=Gulosibacter molinativorax TaxID=256821 RepID=A0ABT7C7L1_9MICO|nr:ferritin [Gulosibacter molinativorax]MDJ1370769.1 ferritin [Gulosibacter molinativorax]QUY63204.1 Ferritin [Gulosibacter molinativorax]